MEQQFSEQVHEEKRVSSSTVQSANPSASDPEPVLSHEFRFDLIYQSLLRARRQFILPLIVVFALSAAFIYSLPRYYTVKVMLAPESSGGSGGGLGSLGGLASMAGINLSSMQSSDAIAPLSYPDLMTSTDFIAPLLSAQVSTADSSFKGYYVDYLTKHTKYAWWMIPFKAIKKALLAEGAEDLFPKDAEGKVQVDPFRLSKPQFTLFKKIQDDIECSVDKKTDIITLTTTAQDPLVAAQLANTVKADLQKFITDYRTQKARNDLEHYRVLLKNAQKDYRLKQREYVEFADANQNAVLPSYKAKETDLENELQMAYTAYSQLKMQVQMAEAKVMERTPVFTTLQNAYVPTKPAGPKRMIFIATMLVLCVLAKAVHIIVKDKTLKF